MLYLKDLHHQTSSTCLASMHWRQLTKYVNNKFWRCYLCLNLLRFQIVSQCNEAARNKEREFEMRTIASKISFGKLPPLQLVSGSRWLIKSGPVVQMISRIDDAKLTFGKRFTKIPLFLFLFNDLFLVTKQQRCSCEILSNKIVTFNRVMIYSECDYLVLHYCQRNLTEVSPESVQNLPAKDTMGRHLLFLTILENQDGKLIELVIIRNHLQVQ